MHIFYFPDTKGLLLNVTGNALYKYMTMRGLRAFAIISHAYFSLSCTQHGARTHVLYCIGRGYNTGTQAAE